MTRCKSLLVLALSATVLAAPAAFADEPRLPAGYESVKVEFVHKSWLTPKENYQTMRRQVRKGCTTPGLKLAVTRKSEQVCIDGMTDKAVAQLGRRQIADLHFAATGRRVPETQLASAR